MTQGEKAILSVFRTYAVRPREMLFINGSAGVARLNSRQFDTAMQLLIDNGLVARDRRKHSYYLTAAGYSTAHAQ